MNLDLSDFRIALSLGHLRYASEKLEDHFTDGGRRSVGIFCCRGHHHDPVFDYQGMPGAYPIVLVFPYLAQPSQDIGLSDNLKEPPLSIAKIIFGDSSKGKGQFQKQSKSMSPVHDHLDLVVPTFWALIVDSSELFQWLASENGAYMQQTPSSLNRSMT
jgi:hypothetical protein